MDAIHFKYIQLAARSGVDLSIETIQDPSAPPAEVLEENEHFTIHLNPTKFLPNLTCEQYLGYFTAEILLPRLVLETDRLLLRRCRTEDAEDFFPFLSDEKGCYLDCSACFHAMDEAFHDYMNFLVQHERQYAIVLKETGRAIGTVKATADNSRAVNAIELGYCIAPAYQRQGYAFEALSALIHLLMEDLQFELLLAGTLAENTLSIRLLKKLGFQKEGMRRKGTWHEGLDRSVDLQYYYLDKAP